MENGSPEFSAFRAALDDSIPNQGATVLVDLLFYIGQAARGAYPQAGTPVAVAADQLRSFNEMALIVASELQALMTETGPRRSVDDLWRGIFHWARVGNCQTGLQWALDKTLARR